MTDLAATNLTYFFGRFHPLMVHLPIGLLAALAVLELADRLHHFKHAAQARGLLLFLTVISAVTAVVLGLMLASGGGYDPHLLAWHKWTGIALAAACCLTAVSYWTRHHRPYVGLLMLTLLLLTPAAHYGGSMTHGTDYLTAYAPGWVRSLAGEKPTAVATADTKPKITDPAQAVLFSDVVHPILAANCVSCHGAEKLKGDLRADSFDALKHGGKTGPAFVPGKSADSLLVHRLLLPPEDSKHMPPAGKPQLTDDQIAILQYWIDSGATPDKKVGELDPPVAIADAITASLGITVAGPPADPVPYDELAPQIASISAATGVVVTRIAPNQPWLNVNAAPAGRSYGDAELAQIAPLARNITWLSLGGTQVTDAGLAPLADMPNLERLRLERTGVTDAGLKPLARLRKLSYLNLYATPVTDDGLKTLAGLPALRHLYLWKTQVTPDAAKAFAAARTDQAKIDRINHQIAALQSQLLSSKVEVVEGLQPPAPAPVATTAPTPAPAAAPSTAVAAVTNAAPPAPVAINKTCPVSGKPIDPTKFVDYKGKRVAFCCDNCPKEFQKDPAKYADKLLAAATEPTK